MARFLALKPTVLAVMALCACADRRARPGFAGQEAGFLRHAKRVSAMALSPDGRLIAAGDDDGGVFLWERATAHRRKPPDVAAELAGRRVGALAFSPDGSRLAVTGRGSKVWVWDVAHRRVLRELACPDAIEFYSVAFSPDGGSLAASDLGVHVWDLETGTERFGTPKDEETLSLAFSPDGRAVAARSYVRPLRVFSAASGRVLATCEESMPPERPEYLAAWAVAFSPDGKRVASAIDRGRIGLWDPATGRKIRELAGDGAFALSVAFSPDGKWLAALDLRSEVLLWDLDSGRAVSRFRAQDEWLPHCEKRATLAFGRAGTLLAATTIWSDRIFLWHLPQGGAER